MSIEDSIIPGRILYLSVCFPHETEYHDKYFVVVATGNSPLLLKLNTSDKQLKISKKKQESHFMLKKSVYPFLDHDRFLDCGTLWVMLITIEDIVKQLINNPDRVKGEVTEDHKNEIIRRTVKSRSIESRHKRVISEALKKK